MDIRTGNGIDFHRFIENKERPLVLGGIEIDSPLALDGHSDADVVLHAISDAILGALGLEDIGYYFPDTDATIKNIDSSIILKKSISLMKEKKFILSNCDITYVGEKPKISPYRKQIKEKLAEILGITEDRIGLKATTTEKMGSIGRVEGVMVFASVILIKDIQ